MEAVVLQGWNRIEGGDDLHYRNVLSSLSKSTYQLILGPSINFSKQSCFLSWRNGGSIDIGVHQRPRNRTPQRMLKNILFDVHWMHTLSSIQCEKEEVLNPEADELASSHFLIEDGKEKVNERFLALQSLLPSVNKVERSSILDDTITYLKELEKRVKDLEKCLILMMAVEERRGKKLKTWQRGHQTMIRATGLEGSREKPAMVMKRIKTMYL